MFMVTPTNSKLVFFDLYTTCFILLSYHVAASPFSFSFDFSNGSTYRSEDLLFEGSASLDGRLVDLTCNTEGKSMNNCIGRMSYNHPVPFYHTSTGEVASFSTRFNFAITVFGNESGDGMAFFLSSYPSMLPPDSVGGSLGLHDGDGMNANGTKRFIAVEFDKFQNSFDPSSDHIGIDINTVKAPVDTTILPDFSLEGSMTATITFNATTRMLVASLQFDDHPSLHPVQVSAQLPDPVTDLLPPEVAVGFSAATGRYSELHRIISWSFNSTLVFEGSFKEKRKQLLVIHGAVLSITILVVFVLVWCTLSCFRWRRTRDSFLLGTTGLRRFEYSDLVDATSRFSKAIGEGAFGTVYKGRYTDKNGTHEVAVKRKKQTTEEVGDFMAELGTISETRHTNLVELKGWCCSRNKWDLIDFMCWCRKQRVNLFLVYELVPNGTLDDHLHRRKEILQWEKRYQIVKGIGCALRYLHHECNKTILHRDIKPENILLDYSFDPKLTDFGLSRIIASKKNTTLVTTAIGTVGYMDPECIKDGDVEFTRKSDVYSFGIVLLEIACRKTREQVLQRFESIKEPQMVEAADEKLNGIFDKMQMERVIVLGLKCSDPQGKQRPYMRDAMKFLEDGIKLPAIITEIEGQQGAAGTTSSDKQALLTSKQPS